MSVRRVDRRAGGQADGGLGNKMLADLHMGGWTVERAGWLVGTNTYRRTTGCGSADKQTRACWTS